MKKLGAVLFAFVFAVSLASCGAKSEQETAQAEETEVSKIETAEELTGNTAEMSVSEIPEEKTEEVITESDWEPVYKKTLESILGGKEILLEKEEVNMPDVCFCLIYLDNDDIPELVVSSGFNHTAEAVLYSFSENAAVRQGSFGSFGKLQYVPRKGIIKSEYSGMGDVETSYYRYENGALLNLSSLKKSSDIYNESAAHKYYVNDSKVSADAYKAEMERYETTGEFINAPASNIPDDSGNLPGGVYYLTADSINKFQ